MLSRPMRISQHTDDPAPGDWLLPAGRAMRLKVGPGPRALQVLEGRLWLTPRGHAGTPPPDVWLAAGESLRLGDGSVWVIEAWGAARFQLLVPPEACARSSWLAARWSRWLRLPGAADGAAVGAR